MDLGVSKVPYKGTFSIEVLACQILVKFQSEQSFHSFVVTLAFGKKTHQLDQYSKIYSHFNAGAIF